MHSKINNKKIAIVGNGSGGHFYPSKKVADELEKNGAKIYYVVAKNRLDENEIKKSNFKFISLEYLGLKNNYLKFIKNQIKNYKIIRKFLKQNSIDFVIGFGGGLSFSLALAAISLKIKTFIHEQNAILGRANKILARKVKLLTAYKMDNYCFVGNPLVTKTKNKEVEYYDVIIVCGSQGSTSINELFIKYFEDNPVDYKVLFIVGKNDVKLQNKNITVKKYVEDLFYYFKKARLVITRGGASTLAELSMTNCKLCIIPSPYVINNHQYFNALEFQKDYGAEIIMEKELSTQKISEIIDKNMNDFLKYNERIKVEKNNFLDLFIQEIENEI